MKNVKREMNFYSIYDRQGLQKHLEEMAAKGWMLDKMGQYIWYYRRTEPRKLQFAVSYFPSASVFDPMPSEKQETYREFCEHAGWKLAGSSAQMEIYWNENENAVPLVTDPLVEIETIHKTAKKTVVLSNVLLLGIAIMNVCRIVSFYRNNTISALLSTSELWMIIMFVMAGFFCLSELVCYFKWYLKAKKVAKLDESFLETKSRYHATKRFLLSLVLLFALGFLGFMIEQSFLVGAVIIGYTLLIFAIVFGIKELLKENLVSAKANRIITFVSCFVITMVVTSVATIFLFRVVTANNSDISEADLPLCLEDLIEMDNTKYSCYIDEKDSIFLRKVYVRQDKIYYEDEGPELAYSILDVKIPAVYDICLEYYLRDAGKYNSDINYKEIQDANWNAERVYQLFDKTTAYDSYLLCYDEQIVSVTLYYFDTNENPDFAKIISEKLKPN